MKQGLVKFFNTSRGFGFIIERETGNEYFVHKTGILEDIQKGDEVGFEIKPGKKPINGEIPMIATGVYLRKKR